MMLSRAIWLSVLFLNVLWLLLLRSSSGRATAIAGVTIAAAALVLPLLFARAADYLNDSAPPKSRLGLAAAVVPFLLPALSLIATPHLAVWVLDGRSWLILAWLWLGIVLCSGRLRTLAAGSRRLPFATALFLVWSSALWGTVVGDLGITAFVVNNDRTIPKACQFDPLTVAFSIWETQPASQHLFLGWRFHAEFEKRQPYANHVHAYLLTMYSWVSGVRATTHVALHTASNTTPFLSLFVVLAGMTTLLTRLGLLQNRNSAVQILLLFVACGLVVTSWRFWDDSYRYATDNPYPLLAGLLMFVYAFLLEPVRPVLAVVSGAVFVALGPIHTPMLIVVVAFMFGHGGSTPAEVFRRNRVLVALSVAALGAGLVAFSLPRLLIAWNGYTPQASTWTFRSGLDGDTGYFSNIVQAVVAPCALCCGGRTPTALVFPAFVPLLVFVAWAWRSSRGRIGALGHLLLFLSTPYLMSVVLFPQAVSIHPYLYDHLLLVPVTVGGVVAMLNPALAAQLRGGPLFAALLLLGGVLMSNLISIAQGLAHMPK